MHEVPPYDAIRNTDIDVCTLARCARGICRTDTHATRPPPNWSLCAAVPKKRLALLNVLAQVESDNAEGDFLLVTKLLQNLKLNGTLGEVVVLVDGNADVRDGLAEGVVDHVVDDGLLVCATTMLGVDGVLNVPLDEGVARDERHIVEVMNLKSKRFEVRQRNQK